MASLRRASPPGLARRSVTVRVPATSANLGPGFDCVGIALNLFNDLTVEAGVDVFSMSCEGEGADALPRDASNLVVEGAKLAFRAAGFAELPPLRFHLVNRIPIAAGLGSSSAAIVAGLLAGQVLTGTQLPVAREEAALQLAATVEGHVDNLAPCIYGGLQVGINTGSRWYSTGISVAASAGLQCVVFVPDRRQSTQGARAVLPAAVPRADAVFNIGRTALLINAFITGCTEDLALATQDRLHQPARAAIMPALSPCVEAALAAGARGAFLSGAGSSILALTTGRKGDAYGQATTERCDAQVARAMRAAAKGVGMSGRSIILAPSAVGAHVLEVDGASAVVMEAVAIGGDDDEDEVEEGAAEKAQGVTAAAANPPASSALGPAAASSKGGTGSIRYISTRQSDPLEGSVTFEDAVFAGVAPDGGLYVPVSLPEPISTTQLRAWAYGTEDATGGPSAPASYAAVAFDIIHRFAGDDALPAADLRTLCEDTYGPASGRWDTPEVAPLVELPVQAGGGQAAGDAGAGSAASLWLLEQFHGPTCAFKDHALQLLGGLFAYFLARRGDAASAAGPATMTILGATSGDTGSAAIAGLRGRAGISVFILHPAGGVAPVQALQMTTALDAGVHNIALEGGATFDDCQAIVKGAFADAPFKARHKLSAINSINWARILGQLVYQTWAYVQWMRTPQGRVAVAASAAGRDMASPLPTVRVCVPTGNFGNALSAYYARRLGVPLGRIHIATNANDILHRFISAGDHRLAPTVAATLAPSMDIQVSSNLERYIYHAAQATGAPPAAVVCKAMAELAGPARAFTSESLPPGVMQQVAADFTSSACDDARIDSTIERYIAGAGYALCPHTACAVWGAEVLLGTASGSDHNQPVIVLATAHPAKFAEGTPALRGRGLYAETYSSSSSSSSGGGGDAVIAAAKVPALVRPPLPPQLQGLSSRPRRCISLALPLPTAAAAAAPAAGPRGLSAVQAVMDALAPPAAAAVAAGSTALCAAH